MATEGLSLGKRGICDSRAGLLQEHPRTPNTPDINGEGLEVVDDNLVYRAGEVAIPRQQLLIMCRG